MKKDNMLLHFLQQIYVFVYFIKEGSTQDSSSLNYVIQNKTFDFD